MAILYGTQSNGETLPVLVDQFGNLLAKGIEGPPGPEGPPGVGELPPGAFDGAYLGWQNGELVWFGTPLPPVVSSGFRPIIYTGNGGTQSITGIGFSPDFVWIKLRTAANSHALFDTVRGANLRLKSDDTSAESQSNGSLTSFDTDGFTVGNNPSVNGSSDDLVAWCWDGGDTTVTNNDGTIESQVRSNGNFSVVSYSGTSVVSSVGHGLSKAPSMIFVKSLNNQGYGWRVYHESLGVTQYLVLNQDRGSDTYLDWDNTAPTDTVINLGGSGLTWTTCADGTDYIAYCWAETPGVSSFGGYTGNGSRNSVVTGFSPSFVMIKSTGTGNWFMFDNARGSYKALYANLVEVEADTGAVEFLEDGFQLLFGLPGANVSGETYIYAAFSNPEDAAYAQRHLRRQAKQEERQQNETHLR